MNDLPCTKAVAFAVRAGHNDLVAHLFLETLCEAGILGQPSKFPETLRLVLRRIEEERQS